MKGLFLIILWIGLVVACLTTYWEYQATLKYFPGMTFMEWVLLGDKIRITG